MTPRELAAQESKPIALAWVDAAIPALREYLEWLVGGEEPKTRRLVTAALTTNFSMPSAGSIRIPYVWQALGIFTRVREVILGSDKFFFDARVEEASVIFPGGIPAAYAIYERGVFFTPAFTRYSVATGIGFGPLCRAAMVIHESVHVIDRRSGEPAIHISEWDEPRFSAQTTEESVHNPSSYASFAAQVYTGAIEWPRSVRYGKGRPAD